jgi:hypothetical protein
VRLVQGGLVALMLISIVYAIAGDILFGLCFVILSGGLLVAVSSSKPDK